MLVTNDAKYFQWNQTEFVADYLEMATTFMNLENKPDLYIMIPPPLYKDGDYNMNQTVINKIFPELIPEIAKQLDLEDDKVIDIYNILGGSEMNKFEMFCDG
jgi:hypothetical protein